jgi:hypothetical protein
MPHCATNADLAYSGTFRSFYTEWATGDESVVMFNMGRLEGKNIYFVPDDMIVHQFNIHVTSVVYWMHGDIKNREVSIGD